MHLGAFVRAICLFCCVIAFAPAARAERSQRGRSPVAVIDMGSSGAKLLVQDHLDRTLVDTKRSTGLGRDIGPDRLLPRANQVRTLAVLSELAGIAKQHGVPAAQIVIVTTAAVRNADGTLADESQRAGKKSGRAFVEEDVRGALGLVRTRILSGHEEATIGYQGALAGFIRGGESEKSRFVVVDTGSGSHQVSAGTLRSATQAGSTQVGANQVAEQILVDARGAKLDTVSDDQLRLADEKIAELVPTLPIDAAHATGARVVAIGGASKLLSSYFGRLEVTRGEIERFRREVARIPAAARGEFLRRDAHGVALDERQAKVVTRAAGGDVATYGASLPSKLTLFLRVMTLLGKTAAADSISFSDTDARHVLATDALHRAHR